MTTKILPVFAALMLTTCISSATAYEFHVSTDEEQAAARRGDEIGNE
jgi:hypothetical protein